MDQLYYFKIIKFYLEILFFLHNCFSEFISEVQYDGLIDSTHLVTWRHVGSDNDWILDYNMDAINFDVILMTITTSDHLGSEI